MESAGIKMYKQHVKIYDKEKVNYLYVLVASPIERDLKDYLNYTNLTLEVNSIVNPERTISSPSGIDEPKIEKKEKKSKEIFIETIVANIPEGYKNYSVRFTIKNTNAKLNGVLDTWSDQITFDSNLFDDWIKVQRTPTGTPTTNDISIKAYFKYHPCGLCGWKTDHEKVIYASDAQQWDMCTVDARRLSVRVYHNYSNYIVTCGNW
jgi:hypothetical protein